MEFMCLDRLSAMETKMVLGAWITMAIIAAVGLLGPVGAWFVAE